jgi:hypothetical protein
MQHPVIRPIFRCRPERDSGMPVLREIRAFIAEIPVARFHENETPYLRLRAMGISNARELVIRPKLRR